MSRGSVRPLTLRCEECTRPVDKPTDLYMRRCRRCNTRRALARAQSQILRANAALDRASDERALELLEQSQQSVEVAWQHLTYLVDASR